MFRVLSRVAAASLVGTVVTIAGGPRADIEHARRFAERVRPPGWWPSRPIGRSMLGLARELGRIAGVVVLVVGDLMIGHRLLFVLGD